MKIQGTHFVSQKKTVIEDFDKQINLEMENDWKSSSINLSFTLLNTKIFDVENTLQRQKPMIKWRYLEKRRDIFERYTVVFSK